LTVVGCAELTDACADRKRDAILDVIKGIHDRRLERFLRDKVHDALTLADELKEHEISLPILAMDKKTMSEIKSYSKPSPIVHKVMQAALLLLGEDEEKTSVRIDSLLFIRPSLLL
jgi:hypothetical protein